MDIHQPLLGVSDVHSQQVDQLIQNHNPDAPSVGNLYIVWSRIYGIVCEQAVGQAIQETGYFGGDSCNRTHNPAGMMGKNGLINYKSWRDGVKDHCAHLREYAKPSTWFYQEGVRRTGEGGTLRSMSSVWCPAEYQPPGMPGGDAYAVKVATLAQNVRDMPKPPPPGHTQTYSKDAMAQAVRFGVLRGYDNGYTRPDWPTTRAELMVMFNRAKKFMNPLKTRQYRDPVDVPTTHWAYAAVKDALQNYWCELDSASRFYPDSPAVRQDLALALTNSYCAKPVTRPTVWFPDFQGSNSPGSFTEANIVAYRAGWLSGYPDGTFRPLEPITRGDVALVLDTAFGWSRAQEIAYIGGGEGPGEFNQAGLGIRTGSQQNVSESAGNLKLYEVGWVDKVKVWMPAQYAKATYGDDGMLSTSYQLTTASNIAKVPGGLGPSLNGDSSTGLAVMLAGAGIMMMNRK